MCSSDGWPRASPKRRPRPTQTLRWPPRARAISMSAFVYLDHNATSPLRPAAFDAMAEALRTGGNPSAVHRAGRKARGLVDAARRQVAALVGALPAEVVFTSGGTEANNMALAGSGRRRGVGLGDGDGKGVSGGQGVEVVAGVAAGAVGLGAPGGRAVGPGEPAGGG